MVGCPGRDIARVFGNQLQIAGLDIQPVGVKDLFVPLVQADDQVGRVIFEVIDHLCSDAVKRRQVTCAGAITSGHIEVIVFVAAIIFNVQEILISFPEEAANIPILDLSDLFRLSTGFLLGRKYSAGYRLVSEIRSGHRWARVHSQLFEDFGKNPATELSAKRCLGLETMKGST